MESQWNKFSNQKPAPEVNTANHRKENGIEAAILNRLSILDQMGDDYHWQWMKARIISKMGDFGEAVKNLETKYPHMKERKRRRVRKMFTENLAFSNGLSK